MKLNILGICQRPISVQQLQLFHMRLPPILPFYAFYILFVNVLFCIEIEHDTGSFHMFPQFWKQGRFAGDPWFVRCQPTR